MSENLKESERQEYLVKVQKFTRILNRDVEDDKVKTRDEYSYLPISFLEMTLDELFFGQWETRDFQYQQVINEMVGSITLRVLHPVTGKYICRTGAGSVAIMQDRGTKLSEFSTKKKPRALETGFPKLKAECFKNACLSLGKYFGRDLNRRFFDEYSEVIRPHPGHVRETIEALDLYQGDDKDDLQKMCAEKKACGEFTEEFAAQIMGRINGTTGT